MSDLRSIFEQHDRAVCMVYRIPDDLVALFTPKTTRCWYCGEVPCECRPRHAPVETFAPVENKGSQTTTTTTQGDGHAEEPDR